MSMERAARRAFWNAFAAGLRPDPVLTVSEWADENRMLPSRASAEPGPWRTSRTPYLREIMDTLSVVDPTEMIVVMKGAQIGGTECGNNWLGYIIHHAPGPMLFVQPTVEMAKRTSKQRIGPMIEECPALAERVLPARSRDSGNTVLSKEFAGGLLVLTGANSAVGLRSMPVRYLFLDEVDGYEADVDGEGDPVELAIKRTLTYSRNRKVLIVSTPTVKGISRVEAAFERSDQRYYNVPCPHCENMAPILWRNIRWPKDEPEGAALYCEECGGEIPERLKDRLLADGRWIPTVEDADIRGYHLSGLYSPLGWYSWADAAGDFLRAKKHGPEGLKTWTNTVLGETWEDQGDSVEDVTLLARRQSYPAPVPADALILTAGIDVQNDRLELEVVGWGMGEESWGIEYVVLWGDPGQGEVWQQLREALSKVYAHENGHKVRIAAACIDSGHATQQVYEYVRVHRGALFAIKGMAGEGRPIVSAPVKRRSGNSRRMIPLFTVGVDEAKGLLYSRLGIREPGPGYCHFPDHESYDIEYFAQLAAEKRVTRFTKGFPRREWVKVRSRNEALDCRVYAMAALYIRNPAWKALAERMAKPAGEPKPKVKRQPRRIRSGWMSGARRGGWSRY